MVSIRIAGTNYRRVFTNLKDALEWSQTFKRPKRMLDKVQANVPPAMRGELLKIKAKGVPMAEVVRRGLAVILRGTV